MCSTCFPVGNRSLFGPSLLHAFYLLLRGLVLFVPDSLPPIFLSEHAVSSSSFAIAGITSVPLWCGHRSQHDARQGHPQPRETKTMMTMTAGQLRRGDKVDDDGDSDAMTTVLKTIIIPH